MFLSSAVNFIKVFSQIRALSASVVLNTTKEISLNSEFRVLNLKTLKKSTKKKAKSTTAKTKAKAKKKCIVVKRVSDDIEAVWLENLNCENLKLYRKTSVGSFKVVNLDCLLEKLLEIYPLTFRGKHLVVKTSCCENPVPRQTVPEQPKTEPVSDAPKGPLPRLSNGKKSPACLSEFLIQHMTEFPLLRSQNESQLSKFAEMEVEECGAIDSAMFPSVTGILNETMSYDSRLRLKKWKERMIEELGQEGFNKYQEDLLTEGKKMHATLKTYLQVPDKSLVTVDPLIEGCWKSLEKLLPEISDVKFVEEPIHHPILMYKGIVDCVAAYRGTPCVIEWKKSEKAKSTISDTFDAPIQLCAYLGALTWQKNVNVENGLIVVAFKDGTPAKSFKLSPESCQVYWVEWLRRVQNYWMRKSSVAQEETQL